MSVFSRPSARSKVGLFDADRQEPVMSKEIENAEVPVETTAPVEQNEYKDAEEPLYEAD